MEENPHAQGFVPSVGWWVMSPETKGMLYFDLLS